MNTINLLPKKKWTEKYVVLILLGLFLVLALLISGLVLWKMDMEMDVQIQRHEIVQAELQIEQLNKQLQQAERKQFVQQYVDNVNQLSAEQRDWIPLFELVRESISERTRIVSMEASDEGQISIQFEFDQLEAVSDSLLLFERSDLLEEVYIEGITRDDDVDAEFSIKNYYSVQMNFILR